MGFSEIDYLIILGYLVGIAIFGILSSGKQTSAYTYFLGGKNIPWWAVCFAIVATETSTLTFISIPGVAYTTNFNFLQLTFGYLLGRIAIAIFLLPAYASGEITTAYSLLTARFGQNVRNTASVVFMVTRLLADGVRLYATAIPIKLITGVDYPTAILITALVTLLYTYIGGVRSVIWMDVVQMFIYLGGAIAVIFVLDSQIPNGALSVFSNPQLSDKFSIIRMGLDKDLATFFSTPYTLIGSIIGGAFLSMASHGTDQLIVGRVLTTDSLKSSRRAIIVSGIIVMFQFFIFLFIGLLLYSYYHGAAMDPNEVFPQYIIHNIPAGMSGLIIAGLLAAAMSTIAGSMNALASSTLYDLYKPYVKKDLLQEREVYYSRLFTFIWGLLLVVSAMFFMNTTKTVVELALSIASFTYGGLLGTFCIGILMKRIGSRETLIGFAAGIIAMVFVIYQTKIAWTWYTVIGCTVTVVIAGLIGLLRKKSATIEQF